MKTKIGILAFCLFYQFCLGQALTKKSLHGMVLNDSVNVESGYVFNVNSKTRTFISPQGFFDILAKTNDTLLISSLGLKSKRIVLSEKDFTPSLIIIRLNVFVNQLEEVVVKKIVIKPNLGNIQSIIDTQYFEDKQSSLNNPLMPYHEIVYGMDVIRVGKMIWKIFVKENPEKTKTDGYGDFSEIVPKRISPFFFTNTLQLKKDEIGLFLIYCENDPKAKELLNPNLEFELIEFLITKNEEFKRFTTFEN
ncbi:hypothetical protein [Flavobacterium sp.]|uniref:hypothetical protein n=1 Tax=Flavobacterium sp. TaxID=239 RepID=UPI0037504239